MNRSQGVVVPQSQKRDDRRGEPGKVYNVVPVQQFAVQYANERGEFIKEFWYKVGDVTYQPPGAEKFATDVREVKESLAKQTDALLNAILSPNNSVPEGSVDVMDGSAPADKAPVDV